MNEPKFLILTTNRTATGELVYAPCGDVFDFNVFSGAVYRMQCSGEVYSLQIKWDNLTEEQANKIAASLLPPDKNNKPSGELFTAKPSKIEIAYGEPAARPLEIGVEYPKEEVKP
jgi:hypothetical protein